MTFKGNTMFSFKPTVILIAITTILISLSACRGDQTCRAQITVVNVSGVPVSGASVKLYVAPEGLYPNIESEKTTNANGLAEFAYKDPVILNIEARLNNLKSDSTELIKLDKGKTNQKTVTIK
jgi:hypothetical protein